MAKRAVVRRRVVTNKKAEIAGLKDLQAKFKDLIEASSNQSERTAIAKVINNGIHETAEDIKNDVLVNGKASRVPAKALSGVFKFYDPSKAKKNSQRNALVGINKQRSMVEWTAAPGNKNSRKKVSPGGNVAMSLAAMVEIGTSRMPARPYFGPAIQKARREIPVKFATMLKAALKTIEA